MHRGLLGIVLLAALSSCWHAATTDPKAVRQIIEDHNAQAKRWYAAGRVDSLAALFAEDVWQLPPNSRPIVGRDSLRRYWATALKWGGWDFDLATQDVVTSGALAVERGRYAVKFTAAPHAPLPSFADSGNYVVLWREERDGQWRAVWDAPVSVLAPPGQPNQ